MDAMVDIETLGTGPEAVVLSVGAVAFEPCGSDTWDELMKKDPNRRCFYARLDADEQHFIGRTITPSTVAWWMRQDNEAKKVFGQQEEPFEKFATGFTNFVHQHCAGGFLWGNGPAFDNVILRSLFLSFGYTFPFPYYNDNCYRTIKRLGQGRSSLTPPKPKDMVAHNALDDAVYQALNVQHWMKKIGMEVIND